MHVIYESVQAHIELHPELKNMKFYIDRFHSTNHSRLVILLIMFEVLKLSFIIIFFLDM